METILEYKYQIALKERWREYQHAQETLAEKRRDYEALRGEIAKSIRGESKFGLALLQSLLEETGQDIEVRIAQLYELEAKLQNAEQLRREIEIKQRKYCGLNYIFTNGTMEEKKMLLSILLHRIAVGRGYELNIQLAPGFEQFLDGLIETRPFLRQILHRFCEKMERIRGPFCETETCGNLLPGRQWWYP